MYPGYEISTQKWEDTKKKVSEKHKLRLENPDERKKISDATKVGMADPSVKEKHMASVKRRSDNPDEWKRKLSDATKRQFANMTDEEKKVFYSDERNEKIRQKKLEYWEAHPEEKARVAETWKKVRDKNPEKWKKHLLSISQSGFEAAWGKKNTELEVKYYEMLESLCIKFERQKEVGGKIFDAYLPEHNLLLEFDGDFWHPPSIDECQYDWQVSNFYNDRIKDNIAKTNEMRLIRVRESEPLTKEQLSGLVSGC